MRALVVTIAVVLTCAGTAHAEPRDDDGYVAPMALTDTAILAAALPALVANHDGVSVALFGLAYVSAGPLIHGANGNRRERARSLAKRVVIPVVAGALGAFVGVESEVAVGPRFAAIGAGVGMIVAVISDWTRAHVRWRNR